jgi:hypothetical protein
MGERKGLRLVDPHQRRVDDETPFHAEIERKLHSLQRVVAAVRIAGIVGLAHAGDDMFHATAIGERPGESKEDQIAAGHEGRRQPGIGKCDCRIAGERRLRDRGERVEREQVVVTEPLPPAFIARRKAFADARAHLQFHRMALAIEEPDGLDMTKTRECPGEAHGRILPAGEQNKGAIGVGHAC